MCCGTVVPSSANTRDSCRSLIPVAAQAKNTDWKMSLIALHVQLVHAQSEVNRLHNQLGRFAELVPAVQR